MTDAEVDSIGYSLACRICLQDNLNELSSIFEPDESNPSISVYQKIEECAGIKIINKPELPSNICNKCNAFLTIAYKFRMMCRNSDNYLRKFVCKSPTAEDSSSGDLDEATAGTAETIDNDVILDNYDGDGDGETEVEFLVDYHTEPTPNLTQSNAATGHTYTTGSQDSGSSVAIETYDQEEFIDLAEVNDENSNVVHEDGEQDDNSQEILIPLENVPVKTLSILSDGGAIIQIKENRSSKRSHAYACNICGNTYPFKAHLDAHMRRHRAERQVDCD